MTERNAIDGYHNTPHSTSVDNFQSTYPGGGGGGTLERRGSRGNSPQKQYQSGMHMPNSSSYPLGFQARNNGNAIYNNNNGSLTRHYHQQQPGGTHHHHQHTSSNLSSNSTGAPTTASNNNTSTNTVSSPQHSVNSSNLSSQSQNSFQHATSSLTRCTLPNDYKHSTYSSTAKQSQPPTGWVSPTSSNVTSRTATPQPSGGGTGSQLHSHQLNTTTTSDGGSSRLSRSFDSRSLDRKEQRKSRSYNNTNNVDSSGASNGSTTNYQSTIDSRTSVHSNEQRVTSPTRQTSGATTATGKGKPSDEYVPFFFVFKFRII